MSTQSQQPMNKREILERKKAESLVGGGEDRIKSQQDWLKDTETLIQWNDGEFKYYLDRYKYADRHPDFSAIEYRRQAEQFLAELEKRLYQNTYLCGNHFSLADAVILPFIRQFTAVDSVWFESKPYPLIQQWLNKFVASNRFIAVMTKYEPWKPDDLPIKFGH